MSLLSRRMLRADAPLPGLAAINGLQSDVLAAFGLATPGRYSAAELKSTAMPAVWAARPTVSALVSAVLLGGCAMLPSSLVRLPRAKDCDGSLQKDRARDHDAGTAIATDVAHLLTNAR